MKSRASDRGAALLLVTILISTIMVMASVVVSQTMTRSEVSTTLNDLIPTLYAADAGIEQVKYNVRASSYNATGNVWLLANSSTSGYLAIDNMNVNNINVDVSIKDLGTGWNRITSTATRPDGKTTSVAMEVKGRDSFSKYMFFIDLDSINIGTTTVRGDTHSNRSVDFYYGGAKMYGNVTACRGIGYYSGANASNTTFYKDVDGYVATIPWPKASDIATLHDTAQGVYQLSNLSPYYSGFGSFNTELTFNGNMVTITTKNPGTGAIKSTGTYPLPANNLIFVQGAVTSLKGDINGRVTIATMDKVDITGKIRYIDNEGDPAYQLYNSSGVPIATTSTGTATWASPTYTYQSNPNYNPTTPSTMGIMALKDVTILPASPYNMEMHAATFSYQGNWHCDLTQKMGNLRVLGSMTQKLGGWRYNGSGYGWAKSGEYIYDERLLTYPPPYWLGVDQPTFSSWRKIL